MYIMCTYTLYMYVVLEINKYILISSTHWISSQIDLKPDSKHNSTKNNAIKLQMQSIVKHSQETDKFRHFKTYV